MGTPKIAYAGRRKNRPHIHKSIFESICRSTISKRGYTLKSLQYVFLNDEELLQMNRDHLQHDYYTDIITFDLSQEKRVVQGEIYISIDRVLDNASSYKAKPMEEMLRVMFHGMLHLLGHKDKSTAEQKLMRAAENECLTLYRERSGNRS